MASNLATATTTQAARAPLVLVPVGSIEQHGPHLPLDTDTTIAVAVAEAVAATLAGHLPGTWVAPALSYGSSGEHQSFAGTCSIGTPTLRLVLVELVRSMRTWADRVVFVNAHGGNLEALRSAVAQMRDEGHDVTWVPCATEEFDLHAGHTETSLMLHLRPRPVRMDRAQAGTTAPIRATHADLITADLPPAPPKGTLGEPTTTPPAPPPT